MCVIIVKNEKQKIPTKEYLKKAWICNPDGAGYMFADDSTVKIRKGFMSFEAFIEALERDTKKYDLGHKNVVLHFRIATHGGVNAVNTQPFAISNNIKDLQALSSESSYGFAHNGIIYGYGDNKKQISDTADFTMTLLSKLDNISNDDVLMLLDELAYSNSSRFVLMANDGTVHLMGAWEKDAKTGYMLSNKYFLNMAILKSDTTAPAYTSSMYDYDDYDYHKICDSCGEVAENGTKYLDGWYLCDDCYDYFKRMD